MFESVNRCTDAGSKGILQAHLEGSGELKSHFTFVKILTVMSVCVA